MDSSLLTNDIIRFPFKNYEDKQIFKNTKEYVSSLRPIQQLQEHKGCINCCTFNSYGDRLLTGSDDGSVWMWDLTDPSDQPMLRLRPNICNVFTNTFLSQNRFVTGANEGIPRVVTINQSDATVTSYLRHHIRKVVGSYAIDENVFITISWDGTIRLFDIRQKYSNTETRNISMLTEMDYMYESYQYLIESLQRYNINPQGGGGGFKGEHRRHDDSCDDSLLVNVGSSLYSIDPYPFDNRAFIVAETKRILYFDIRNLSSTRLRNCCFHFYGHYNETNEKICVTGCKFNSKGDKIAFHARYGSAYDIPTNYLFMQDDVSDLRPRIYHSHSSRGTDKAIAWFNDFILTGSDDGELFVYDPEDAGDFTPPSPTAVLRFHQKNLNVCTVHEKRGLLATSGVDYYACLWSPQLVSNHRNQSRGVPLYVT